MKQHILTLFASLLLVIPACTSTGTTEIAVNDLRCEYRTNPLGIDCGNPRLSWVLESDIRAQEQSAYRVIVAGTRENIQAGKGDLWDSGRIDSNQSVEVVYQGQPLRSAMRCYWKVRVWDKNGNPSDWSESAWWETAMLGEKDWKGKWINDGKISAEKDEDLYKEDPAPLFRREFQLSKPIRQGRLYISGLGYYEAFLNGQRVGDHLLDPAWTMYSKRVFYSTYDVTGQLQNGDNCVGVTVGNGWYNPLPLKMWGWLNLREHLPIGRPRFIAQLAVEYTDGTKSSIVSDESWSVAEGPILRNSIYLGEVYDARREISGWDRSGFDDSTWSKAAPAKEPIGELQAQPLPPVRITTTLKPVEITEPQNGIYIFDMGQNFSGLVRLKLDVPKGAVINLRYGELINKDGTLNPMTSVCGQIKGRARDEEGKLVNVGNPVQPSVAWQGDTYIARGNGGEVYTGRFTWHAFRYVEMTGYPGKPSLDMMEGLRLNTDVAESGAFSCSNEMFNAIQKMCRWTFLSNIFSVQSDCPHRERLGYGGDLVNTSDVFMLNYDMANFYAKAVRDWQDSSQPDGMLTDTAPFVGINYCGVGWAMAHPQLQLQLYQYYGDKRLMEQQYETSKRWFDLVASENPEHIVKEGLSDHEGLASAPSPDMVTPLYYQSARMLAKMSELLGRGQEAQKYQDLAKEIKKAYLDEFMETQTGKFGPGTQAGQCFALYSDLVPQDQRDKAFKFLLDDIQIKHEGHLSTGIFGTKYMLGLLSQEGYADVAYNIVNQKTFPGWGYMLANGATTLWEHWAFSDNTFSHNHPMFGSVSQWFFNWLGGIQPDPEAVGFDRIIIRPQIVNDLQWVKSSYNSVRGPIVSNWAKKDGYVQLDMEIPANTKATVYVPANSVRDVREGLKRPAPATKAQGISALGLEGKTAVFSVGSGKYHFVSKLPQ